MYVSCVLGGVGWVDVGRAVRRRSSASNHPVVSASVHALRGCLSMAVLV